jgi:cysteine desulfurase / selenocysteine lyase
VWHGHDRRYLNLDSAASTSALPAVAQAVHAFRAWYSSVHGGAGYKSRQATQRYELARTAALEFAERPLDGIDTAIVCRNTTEAINHLAYRLPATPASATQPTRSERASRTGQPRDERSPSIRDHRAKPEGRRR